MKPGGRIRGKFPIACAAAVLAVSAAASVFLVFSGGGRELNRERARFALEDISRRVERGVRNLRSVSEMNHDVALSRARALAELIAENPAVLRPENRAKFESYAKLLSVDELHVTDEKGILIRSLPSIYEGYDMSSSTQSAAFLPAIKDPRFEFVQEPERKGINTGDGSHDGGVFQYAGVARRDSPGIVQIGYRAERVAEAMKLADIESIAATARLGRDGRVSIVKLDGREKPSAGMYIRTDVDGVRRVVYDADCEGYRIAVAVAESSVTAYGSDLTVPLLFFNLILGIGLLVALFPRLRARFARALRSILPYSDSASRVLFVRALFNSFTAVVAVFFILVLFLVYVISSHSAMRTAGERLKASAEDVVNALDECVDSPLAFIGTDIVGLYRTPEAMRNADLGLLMKTYALDEINVVDANGICVASTVPAIRGQNEWNKPNPAAFCRALLRDGRSLFSQPFRASATEWNVYRKYVGVAFPPPAKGFVQLGFDRARLYNQIDSSLGDTVRDWHIGESGYYLVAKTRNGEIVSSCTGEEVGKTLADVGFDVFTLKRYDNVDDRDRVSCAFNGFSSYNCFYVDLSGRPCLCTSGTVNQFHRYVAAIPIEEIQRPVRQMLYTAGTAFFVVAVALVWFVTVLRDSERREKDAIGKVLAAARTIQLSSLPARFPDTPEWRIFALMQAAREVGGDFYDFVLLPGGRVFFLIADVSGKGVPAAMFMMKAKTAVHSCFADGKDLASAIAAVNDALAENNVANMFVTAWFGVFDPASGVLEYVNAGHNPPLLKRAEGSVEWIRGRRGRVLAAMDGLPYYSEKIQLAPGDSVLLYTDGVTEAANPSDELFGTERLEAVLRSSGPAFVNDIRQAVDAFADGAEQADDITMLALDFKARA